MKSRLLIITTLLAVNIFLILIAISHQISVGTLVSLRFCSSIEKAHYNSSGEIWRVASDSMTPMLRNGDIVAVERNVTFDDVRVDDIIMFEAPVSPENESNSTISRVSEVLVDPYNEKVLLTKGDANSGSIPGIDFPIYESNFIGIANCIVEEGQFKR